MSRSFRSPDKAPEPKPNRYVRHLYLKDGEPFYLRRWEVIIAATMRDGPFIDLIVAGRLTTQGKEPTR
jgi:hypothetical protein